MALADFSVSVSDVLDRTPIPASQVGSSTKPVNNSQIKDVIQDAESKISAQIERAGLDPSDLSEDQKRQAQDFVEVWSAAEVYDMIGAEDRRYQKYREKANELLNYFDRDVNRWADHTGTIHSNIDTSDTHQREDFTDNLYKY